MPMMGVPEPSKCDNPTHCDHRKEPERPGAWLRHEVPTGALIESRRLLGTCWNEWRMR